MTDTPSEQSQEKLQIPRSTDSEFDSMKREKDRLQALTANHYPDTLVIPYWAYSTMGGWAIKQLFAELGIHSKLVPGEKREEKDIGRPNTTDLHIKVPTRWAPRLKRIAERRRKSLGYIIREALRLYLDEDSSLATHKE